MVHDGNVHNIRTNLSLLTKPIIKYCGKTFAIRRYLMKRTIYFEITELVNECPNISELI